MPDAFRGDKLILKFIKVGNDFPRISAIMIVAGTLEDTYYNEHTQKVSKYKQLAKNKQEISEKPLNYPKEHRILTPVSVISVICKYPLSIVFWSIVFFFTISKLISH